MDNTGHKLLDKQIKRASRFTADGSCDYDLLLQSVAKAYAEKESLSEYYDKTNALMTQEIAESKTFLALILSNIKEGVYGIDLEGKITFINKAATKMLGYDLEDVIGASSHDLFHHSYEDGASYPFHECPVSHTIKHQETMSSETEVFWCRDGSCFPASYSSAPIINDKKEVLGAVVTFQDISERKRIEEERENYEKTLERLVIEKTADLNKTIDALEQSKKVAEQARDEANRSNQAKSEFLANMSHELRTPLNSIIGVITMLCEQETREEQQDMLSIVKRASHMLLETVDDVLDLSKIENKALVLETVPFDFSRAVIEVTDSLAPLASKKGLSLNCTIDKNLTSLVYGDPLRVKRILNNLIGNAIKYTLKGDVDVCVQCEDVEGDAINVICNVKDRGIGIPKEKLNYIFEKFTQVDETTTRRFGGTGLGLAITKELVDMMGGHIEVGSVVGQGSEFSFTLPFKKAQPVAAAEMGSGDKEKPEIISAAGTRVPVSAVKVLVAEDHELNQIFMKKFVSSLGVRSLTLAKNGLEALAFYKTGEFDLILMDCHMPEMSGYEATEAIRKLEEGIDDHIPIIAMTADAMVGSQEKCFECGMDAYLSKPVDKEKAIESLSRWIDFSDEIVAAVQEGSPIADGEGFPPINLSVLDEYADCDEEKKALIDIFFSQADESIEIMQEKCVDGRSEAWIDAAHKIKGGSGMLGVETLHELSKEAQAMVDSTAEEKSQKLDELLAVYQALKGYLDDNL